MIIRPFLIRLKRRERAEEQRLGTPVLIDHLDTGDDKLSVQRDRVLSRRVYVTDLVGWTLNGPLGHVRYCVCVREEGV